MSAEILREAAALMRERAEAATSGPWDEWAVKPLGGPTYNAVGNSATEREVCSLGRDPQGSMDTEHVASWHPAVALAVADWLDAEAYRVERNRHTVTYEGLPMFPASPAALAVARAYLG